MKARKFSIYTLAVVAGLSLFALSCREEEESFEKTRLFRPVLNDDLSSEGNAIIVNMAKFKDAVSYTIELSRDEFATIDYTIESESNYVVINDELLDGDPLFWNTLYQVRAVAHAENPELDSRVSELGAVRTQRFPTIQKLPASYDVTDVAARVTWDVAGLAVTHIKVFAGTDLKLTTPLGTYEVSTDSQTSGEAIIDGLTPANAYQVAIYSGDVLRGWVDYQTLVADVDPAAAGVVDIREDESADAVINAVAAAADGAIILVKRGRTYNLPTVALNKSITIRAAYGFGKQKAKLFTTTNWNIAGGSTISHIRFIDVEIRGDDFAGDYVFNPAVNDVNVGELLFENCEIGTLRGIIRMRNSNVLLDNYKIINCVIDSLGNYGILTTDTPPNAIPTARVNNLIIKGSTINKTQAGISTYNNMQSIQIEDCTFNNFTPGGTATGAGAGTWMRFRGGENNNTVATGISIKNSIFGPGWDQAGVGSFVVKGKDGLSTATTFDVVNVYTTSEFKFLDTFGLTGFPDTPNYSKKQTDLWMDPANNNFSFKDTGFAGRYSSGDPRWRMKL